MQFDGPLVRPIDAGQALEQRALAGSVAPDDPEELTTRDRYVDVLQRVQLVVARRCERVQNTLLERAVTMPRQTERLAEISDRQRGRCSRKTRPPIGLPGLE